MDILIIILSLIVIFQYFMILKSTFKIGYYEQKLENRGVDVDHVKNMSLWKMFRS